MPTAILLAPEGRREVYPASERWWDKVVELRQASQGNLLRCPECDLRVVYVCEGVPTPYFKHYRDEQGCMDAGEDAGGQERRARAWLRHHLVVAFRLALPAGTRLDCDRYLGNRAPWFTMTLPDASSCVLNVVSQPLDLGEWSKLQAELAGTGLPVFHLFAGRRVPAAVHEAPFGMSKVILSGGLNADHLDAARPYLTDVAHAVRHGFYDLKALEADPRTLFFFEAGRTRDEAATLAILRGLMPEPGATVWHGSVVKVPLVEGSPDRLQLSGRHGFFTRHDIEQVSFCRRRWRTYRVRRPRLGAPGPAETHKHPLRLSWEMKREQLRLEREALPRQEALDYARLMAVLKAEGDRLLQGEILPVVEETLYSVGLYEWETALLGYMYRHGAPLSLTDAVAWVRDQGFVDQQNEFLEWENMRAFWVAAADDGLLRRHGDGRLSAATSFPWPVHGATHPGVPQPAVCVVCATVKGDRRRKPRWRVYDPETSTCKCTTCPHSYER